MVSPFQPGSWKENEKRQKVRLGKQNEVQWNRVGPHKAEPTLTNPYQDSLSESQLFHYTHES